MKKNKKLIQINAKEKHKTALLEAKAKRRGEPLLDRQKATIAIKPTILIVCEGENTEPSYFSQFKLSSARIIPVGAGKNTLALVDEAFSLSKDYQYDQVWCVFDKDSFPEANFNYAVQKALSNGLKVAYSNQAFEYWLLLHFEDHQGGEMNRKDYGKKINAYIKKYNISYDYNGSKIISEEFFDVLNEVDPYLKIDRRISAINRADRNDKFHKGKPAAKQESSTKVFNLVQEILKYL